MSTFEDDIALMRSKGNRMVAVRASRIVGCIDAIMIYQKAASNTDDIRVIAADEEAKRTLTRASLA